MSAPTVTATDNRRWFRLVRQEIKYEQLTYWRNGRAAIFTFLLPMILLLTIGLPNRGAKLDQYGGISFGQYFLPGMIAFGLMGSCYTNLAISLAFRRQTGQLLRRRATPIPPSLLIGGLIGSCVIVGTILLVLTTAVGMAFLNVAFPTKLLALVVAVIAGSACFCALGIAVQTLIKDADAAPPMINLPLMFLAFASGNFFPVDPNGTLAKVAGFFPVLHLNRLFQAVFDPRVHGMGFASTHLLNLGLWTLGAVFVASRRFVWAPSTQ